MKIGKDDSDFFGNTMLAAFAVALVLYMGWSVQHAGRSANLAHTYVSATK